MQILAVCWSSLRNPEFFQKVIDLGRKHERLLLIKFFDSFPERKAFLTREVGVKIGSIIDGKPKVR